MHDYCKENQENCMAFWFLSALFMVTFYIWSIRFIRSHSSHSVYSRCREILITLIISNFIEATTVQSLGYLELLGLFVYEYAAEFFAISIFAHHCHFISNILRVYRLTVLIKRELGKYNYLSYSVRQKRLSWKWNLRVILIYTTLCSVIPFFLLIWAVFSSNSQGKSGVYPRSLFMQFWSVWNIIELLIFLIFLIKLSKIRGRLKWKFEMLFYFCIWPIGMTSNFIPNDDYYWFNLLVIPGRNLLILATTLIVLLNETIQTEICLPMILEPEMILESKKVFYSFCSFIEKKKCLNFFYINCLLEIEKFIEICPTSYSLAEGIIRKYITNNEIDVPAALFDALTKGTLHRARSGTLYPDEFNDLRRYIFDSAIRPAFEAFKNSKRYRRFSDLDS
ncbi:unnamed protein product [Blepharisma stoltei]|uniref:RGS domain-containing protein n=1 Tax=Blepharisma stoltei TaxID=1481888 RepID=A0AAU9JIP5_9CILI|nr:unnamed protein product [Blepharisma stoltei]